jgi:hypothetical protein
MCIKNFEFCGRNGTVEKRIKNFEFCGRNGTVEKPPNFLLRSSRRRPHRLRGGGRRLCLHCAETLVYCCTELVACTQLTSVGVAEGTRRRSRGQNIHNGGIEISCRVFLKGEQLNQSFIFIRRWFLHAIVFQRFTGAPHCRPTSSLMCLARVYCNLSTSSSANYTMLL